jgi:hypothetical protein
MDGWMDGWINGWMGVKSDFLTAYNVAQLCHNSIGSNI